jgi:hypothetical protein
VEWILGSSRFYTLEKMMSNVTILIACMVVLVIFWSLKAVCEL